MPSSRICVDANLVVRLVADPKDEVVIRLWDQWDAEKCQQAAPALLYYEVTNALYRYQRQGLMSAAAAQAALTAALALSIQLHDEAGLHERVLNLAERLSLSAAYDAHYLALAEQMQVDF